MGFSYNSYSSPKLRIQFPQSASERQSHSSQVQQQGCRLPDLHRVQFFLYNIKHSWAIIPIILAITSSWNFILESSFSTCCSSSLPWFDQIQHAWSSAQRITQRMWCSIPCMYIVIFYFFIFYFFYNFFKYSSSLFYKDESIS